MIVTVFAVMSLFAHSDIMQPTKRSVNLDETKVILPSSQRDLVLPDAPNYSFDINPVNLGGTIYDYMPGSYCGLPLVIQPEALGGGAYMTYHARQNSTSNRRVYYSYVDASGNLIASGTIASDDIWEGYPGIDMDEETGDPIVAYHLDANGDGVYDDNMSYDGYNLASFPGLWVDPPYTAIDNAQLANQGIINSGDEMIWPYVQIGASPEDGKRRVYISGNNFANSAGGNPSENVVIAYADFSTDDLNAQAPDSWDWHYRTVQQFDNWHNEDPMWARAQKTFIAHNNYVAYVGTVVFDDNSQKMFALVNDNYGEGDFEYVEFDYETAWDNVDDFQLADGSWFIGGETEAQQVKWSAWASWNSHINAIFRDDNTIAFPGALQIEFYDAEQDGFVYYPGYEQIYPKIFTFDLTTHEFGLEDVYPADPTPDNMPILPWDLDEDGNVDQFDTDGYPEYVHSFPMFGTTTDNAFHYGGFKITRNMEQGWEALVWDDASEAYYQSIGIEGYDDWAETPKVMVSLKNDAIGTWSSPIVMNAKDGDDNYVSQFDGMIPVYVYPGNRINQIDDTHGKLHLFFLNDDSYGSSIQSEGATPDPNTCRLEYAALNVDFEYPVGADAHETDITSASLINSTNYPNPFNPTTTIKYNVPENGNVTVEVYNVLGQKVRTLVNTTQRAGENSIVWDGTNNNGDIVASGVYMYKIKNGRHTSTKKMILMK